MQGDVERSLTEINKKIKAISTSCNAASREAKQLSDALKLDPTNSQLLATNYATLGREIQLTTSRLALLNEKKHSMDISGDTTSDAYSKLGVDIALCTAKIEQLKKAQEAAKKAGVDAANAQADATNQLAESEKSLQDAATEANSKASDSADDAADSQEDYTKQINKSCVAMTVFGAVAIAALKGAYSLMKSTAELGSTIYENTKKYGIDTTSYQEQANIWEKATDDANAYSNALSQMQEQIALAGKNTDQTEKALNKLGLTCSDISNLSVGDALELISSKLKDVTDETERTNIAVALLHNSGTDLATVLNTDSATIAQWKSDNSGNIISSEDVEDAEQMNYALENLTNKMNKIKVTVGTALMPLLNALSNILSGLTPVFETLANILNGIGETGQTILAWMLLVIAQLPILAGLMKGLNVIMNANPVFQIVAAVATLLNLVIALYGILHKNVDSKYAEMAYAAEDASNTAQYVAETVTSYSSNSSTTSNSSTQNVTIQNVTVTEGASDTDSLIKAINVKAMQNT